MKIAISGKMCSGKSTLAREIANELSQNNPFNETVILSFAGRLKELATELFNYDDNKKDRKLLQDFGEAIRKIDHNAWIRALDKKIKSLPKGTNVIIEDTRLGQELHYCKSNGFLTIRLQIKPEIQRGRILTLYQPDHLDRVNNHSETALDHLIDGFDYVVDVSNEKELQNLKATIVKLSHN